MTKTSVHSDVFFLSSWNNANIKKPANHNNDYEIAKETSSLAKESEEAVEDAAESVGDFTQTAWNRTKLAAYDAGEQNN